jgi:hypothetical protein
MSDEKNIFVTSHNQMGGITAHTVNLGPTARQMNDILGAQIKQGVPVTAKVTVISVLGDGEAFGFANQILTWMKSNGYSNVNGVDQAVYSGPVMGQNIDKKNDSEFNIIIGTRQ